MTSENQDSLGESISSAISGGDKLPFDLQINAEPKYHNQAEKMVKVFVNSFSDTTHEFDFEKALAAVKAHTTMAVVGTIDQTEKKSHSSASVAANAVKKILEDAFEGVGVSNPADLVANVANAFNLPGKKISPLPIESPQNKSPRYTSSI